MSRETVRKFRALLADPKCYTFEQAAVKAGIPLTRDLSRIANGLAYKEGEEANG